MDEYEKTVKECHAELTAAGIAECEYGTVCNDPTCHSKLQHRIKEVLRRLTALEAQVAEREGAIPHAAIQETIDRVRTGICCRHIDHVNLCCDCAQITDEFAKLLTPPAGKE